jgi:hypothetical protein
VHHPAIGPLFPTNYSSLKFSFLNLSLTKDSNLIQAPLTTPLWPLPLKHE